MPGIRKKRVQEALGEFQVGIVMTDTPGWRVDKDTDGTMIVSQYVPKGQKAPNTIHDYIEALGRKGLKAEEKNGLVVITGAERVPRQPRQAGQLLTEEQRKAVAGRFQARATLIREAASYFARAIKRGDAVMPDVSEFMPQELARQLLAELELGSKRAQRLARRQAAQQNGSVSEQDEDESDSEDDEDDEDEEDDEES